MAAVVKLPRRFMLTISGDVSDVVSRAIVDKGGELKHVLWHLLTGGEVRPDALRNHGLQLIVEEDTDGGEPYCLPGAPRNAGPDWTPPPRTRPQ